LEVDDLDMNRKTPFAVVVACCVASGAFAELQITRIDPPLMIIPTFEFEDPTITDPLAIDFDNDGQVDFRVYYAYAGVEVYFNSPTRIVILRNIYPWTTNIYGSIGTLPLGSAIGSNLVTSVDTNLYIWNHGTTNLPNSATAAYGNQSSSAVTIFAPIAPGYPMSIGGNLTDKEGVMAVEFLSGTNKHYGYIHFDFRSEIGWPQGCGGYILGWAYETEPDKPIVAAAIAVPPTPYKVAGHSRANGNFDLIWRATPGATYRVQGTSCLDTPFSDITSDIILTSGPHADPIQQDATFSGLGVFPHYFWRVVRTH
jgi:hypothetical protein